MHAWMLLSMVLKLGFRSQTPMPWPRWALLRPPCSCCGFTSMLVLVHPISHLSNFRHEILSKGWVARAPFLIVKLSTY